MEGLTNAVTNSKKEGPSSKGVQRDFLEEAGTELRGGELSKEGPYHEPHLYLLST